MNINLLDILILISLSQGLIFGLALLFSKLFKGSTNKYLAYSIMMISIIGLNEWLSGWDFDEQYYVIDFFGDDVPWILLFYVPMVHYFLQTAEHPRANDRRLRWLFLPFLIFLSLNLLINGDVDFGLYDIPNVERFMIIVYAFEYYIALSLSLILCTFSYFIILRSPSSPSKKWLKRIWLFTTILILFWLIVFIIPEVQNERYLALEYSLWLAISCFMYWIIYQGVYQLKLVKDQMAIHMILQDHDTTSPPPIEGPKITPAKNTANFTNDNPYFQKLEFLIQTENLHRNPDLSRDVVAEKLGISPGYLSQLINSILDQNFTSYINAHRVEEVKRMIKDPAFAQYSILAIGMEAGFKSKSAFYTTFKRETGMTPSEFKGAERR